jgi:hypothetical protein
MAVDKKNLDLPICVENSVAALAKKMGKTQNSISIALHKASKKEGGHVTYYKIPNDDEEDKQEE